ncbi:Vi polysaccharide biosynthesis UDP-N-acetylglucosamine C-6 dehydrogenase TviB [Deferribacterales bacterium Es71-Z0220]|uniref:Vi polysaccharide biosynthesis UDP-N-acetylglucosamine C-6 dehydrogenase TviB n=1 Tax=Deferrivibrio essentukiensis TaxID=2880922 RepID=UPI001EC2BA19|nr:Vi polysaccharide biosynthesis UDP-N-acetylglucosamine C-6 dehydrogenase TviB [Deferrivibrio essentukiensis]MBZ4655963.1 nucleotide sugar dehydrogenase [Thermoanaerobacter sp.]MCB4205588.1 Vi polysaccharide biosynthesis UDP-N-acetylglucosamine C-6 dehydrogenase TviB [Deferrivibrio essentukiensis]
MSLRTNNIKIAVIGLGYVGLPLAVEFAKKFKVVGFDINGKRVKELSNCKDITHEVTSDQLKEVLTKEFDANNCGLKITDNIDIIKDCNFYIVTVPTPIDRHKNPDLRPLISASETVGKVLKEGDIVVYESTVYPGCTEEDCVPVLEKFSGLKYNKDFFVGYSPERINPGDKEHTFSKIKKVVSGSTKEVADIVNNIYSQVVVAGTFVASSIKVAEAAKVIENTQRDINIAFINELSMIFDKMNIDTLEVLEAAGTKWNFLPFRPGLVGGHCIGVDPYYLAHKAEELGYHPEMILAGRRINDYMGLYVANQVVKLMIKKGYTIKGARVLVLGITFKENCPDVRNTKVVDVINELTDFGCNVDVYDPWADKEDVKREYNLELIQHSTLNIQHYDAIILAVAHKEFKEIEKELSKSSTNVVIYDIKGFFNKEIVDGRL